MRLIRTNEVPSIYTSDYQSCDYISGQANSSFLIQHCPILLHGNYIINIEKPLGCVQINCLQHAARSHWQSTALAMKYISDFAPFFIKSIAPLVSYQYKYKLLPQILVGQRAPMAKRAVRRKIFTELSDKYNLRRPSR